MNSSPFYNGKIGFTDFISPVVALADSAINYQSSKETNQANKELNESMLDYQTKMTEAQWARDDNAHQREVADLEAAGLSPLVSVNGAQSSSPLGAPSTHAYQAPQVDTNALINSMLQNKALNETKRHNKAQEEYNDSTLDIRSQELVNEVNKLNLENKKVEEEIKYRADLLNIESQKLAEEERSHKKNEEINIKESEIKARSEESQRYYQEIVKQAGGDNVPYKVYDDYSVYKMQHDLYLNYLNRFVQEIQQTSASKSYSSGTSKSSSGSIGIFNSGTGISSSQSKSTSGTESQSQSTDISERQSKEWYQFQQEHPVPVYIPAGKYKTF